MRCHFFFPLLTVALLTVVSGCKKVPPENVAAVVNGQSITYDELDSQYRILFPSQDENISEDEQAIQKLEILRGLIDSEIMLQRSAALGLTAADTDVEAKYTELRSPYTQEEFQKQLEARRMTEEDLKNKLRRDLSVDKLFNKEINSHISITDKDVSDFYEANKASFNFVEPQVRLAQILVTPVPNPNVRNLRSDKAQNDEQAKAKIAAIEARLKQGEDFAMVAQSFSEDPNTAPNGGDLGMIPESSLDQANPELRRLVMSLQPGQISPILNTGEGYMILKVVAKEPAGQRELNDPRVQQTIRGTLVNRKNQLLRAAYYEVARNEADVVNYYAIQISERKSAPTE